MPGGNGTGPRGLGPMTGRAAGYCAGYQEPGYANPVPGRGVQSYGPYYRAEPYPPINRPYLPARGRGFFSRGPGRGGRGRGRGRW